MSELFTTRRMGFHEADEADIDFIIEMENAPENRNYIWQGTREEHLGEIADPAHILGVFWNAAKTVRLGYALIHRNMKSEIFELRRIAIDKKGLGYGREAMVGMIRFAFEKCGTNRFWLDVYPDNEVGIKLYESLGMHCDGMLRESYKSERGYLNQIVYSILKREYFI